eukprot:gene23448-28447_t
MSDVEGKETELVTLNKQPKSDEDPLPQPRPSIDSSDEALWSWNTIFSSLLKEGDQMSPLNLRKMPRVAAYLVIFLLFVSWIDPVDGADCQRLATSDLSINAGCMSVPILNDYKLIQDIVANIKDTVDNYHEANLLPESLYTSLTRHGEITASMRGNSYNQMIDPDVGSLRQWFQKYFIGINPSLYLSLDALPDSLVVAAGIKVIYSYITIGCAISTVSSFPSITIGGDDYVYLSVNASWLGCPTSGEVVGVTYDQAIAGTSRTNNLGAVNMSLACGYVQMPDTTLYVDYDIASVEMLNLKDGQVSHCATSVFTTSPSTLNSVFYECCIEKNDYEKLSEANAFAGLILTIGVIFTTEGTGAEFTNYRCLRVPGNYVGDTFRRRTLSSSSSVETPSTPHVAFLSPRDFDCSVFSLPSHPHHRVPAAESSCRFQACRGDKVKVSLQSEDGGFCKGQVLIELITTARSPLDLSLGIGQISSAGSVDSCPKLEYHFSGLSSCQEIVVARRCQGDSSCSGRAVVRYLP